MTNVFMYQVGEYFRTSGGRKLEHCGPLLLGFDHALLRVLAIGRWRRRLSAQAGGGA
jgi:hypothetical protein